MEYFVNVDGWGFQNKETGEIIAVHPWKERFEARYGTQESLLQEVQGLLDANP